MREAKHPSDSGGALFAPRAETPRSRGSISPTPLGVPAFRPLDEREDEHKSMRRSLRREGSKLPQVENT